MKYLKFFIGAYVHFVTTIIRFAIGEERFNRAIKDMGVIGIVCWFTILSNTLWIILYIIWYNKTFLEL